LPKEPEEPSPTTPLGRIMKRCRSPDLTSVSSLLFSRQNSVYDRSKIDIESNIVEITKKTMQHGFCFEVEKLFVQLPSIKSVKPFEINYEIHASNLPVPVKSKIPVVIERET
jgi:hypothetical protein